MNLSWGVVGLFGFQICFLLDENERVMCCNHSIC